MWVRPDQSSPHAQPTPAGRAWVAPPHGHAHFWERALGRRPLLRAAAGTAGALMAAGTASVALGDEGPREREGAQPRPIPHGLDFGGGLPFLHVRAPRIPGLGDEDDDPISITDFSGKIGYAIIDGTGTGTNTVTGVKTRYNTNVDMRFMTGIYRGLDGRIHHGTFAFI